MAELSAWFQHLRLGQTSEMQTLDELVKSDPRRCLAIKLLLSPSCSKPLSLAMGTVVGCDDYDSPEEGSVAMLAKAEGYKKQKVWDNQAGGLSGL